MTVFLASGRELFNAGPGVKHSLTLLALLLGHIWLIKHISHTIYRPESILEELTAGYAFRKLVRCWVIRCHALLLILSILARSQVVFTIRVS